MIELKENRVTISPVIDRGIRFHYREGISDDSCRKKGF